MFQQRLLPNQGLGKENKGRINPIIASKRSSKVTLEYLLGEVTEKPALYVGYPIVWKSNKPIIWVNQWPLIEEKLQAAQLLGPE